MSWREIVSHWLTEKVMHHDRKIIIMELAYVFMERGIIPPVLMENSALHSILLSQILLETLNETVVPPRPQGNNFVYLMNVKEYMMQDMSGKIGKQIQMLEKDTGVNLEHFYKLNL